MQIGSGAVSLDAAEVSAYFTEAKSFSLARQIPGFGGFASNTAGNIHVYLVDLRHAEYAARELARVDLETVDRNRRAAVKATLLPVLRERQGTDPRIPRAANPQILIEEGQFTFAQLAAWRERMEGAVLDVEGVQFLAIRESKNRFEIGVDRSRASAVRTRVDSVLARLNVPAGAVIYRAISPMVPWVGKPGLVTGENERG